MSMTLGIVMPTYQGADYLTRSIGSVLAQTDPRWTLLISDDGSLDGSLEIAQRYAAKDPRITARRSPHPASIFSNLNPAIADIDATHVTILMQDDELSPDYVATAYHLLTEHPDVQALWFGQHTINDADEVIATGSERERFERIDPSPAAVLSALRRGCIWTISGSCTSRTLLMQRPFDPSLRHAADYAWLLDQLENQVMAYSERAVTRIRMHNRQASSRHIEACIDLLDYFRIAKQTLARSNLGFSQSEKSEIVRRYRRLALKRALGAIRRGKPKLAASALRLWFSMKESW